MSPARLRALLNRIGVSVLVTGLVGALWIWRAQDVIDQQNSDAQSYEMAPTDSRKHVRDVELYYGPLGVVLEKAQAAFHGKGLAATITIASTLSASVLFLIAVRLTPPAEDSQSG